MFGGFATNQSHVNFRTSFGNTADDIGDAARHNLSAGDVVGHEQALGANHHDVVDDHTNQVLPDGVVLIDGLSDGYFGANAVG